MVPEAPLRPAGRGLEPAGPGWFVLNARRARWLAGPLGAFTPFASGDAAFEQVGLNLIALEPGQTTGMYHREANQEDFLVLSGECLLLIEGVERRLRQWDFVHCPEGTDHALLGAGRGCTILGIGARRRREVVYPVSELARRHDVSVERETNDPREAYASLPPDEEAEFAEEWLRG